MDGRIYEAITAYELHLRYYVQALRFCNKFPAFAFWNALDYKKSYTIPEFHL